MKWGQNMAVFILFFGIALVHAIQDGNWLLALLFFLVGAMSLYGDNKKLKK